jgi:aldose 1-epimerase
MVDILTLETEALRLEVAPGLGGAVLCFEAKRDGHSEAEPIFRPASPDDVAAADFDPNTSACYPLVPWVSRLSPAALPTSTGPLAIPPNRPGEAFPIHGWGTYSAWRILSRTATALSLGLDHDGPPPFSARLEYALSGAALTMTLNVVNRLDRAVGLGLGFHPWLPRHASGRLYAPALCVWMSGADKIPFAAEAPPEDWDFSRDRSLPERDVDHGFGGWTGTAHYDWTARDGTWRLEVASDCDEYILYAPAGRSFFCFEPTSHKPSPGQTGELDGLVMVEAGKSLGRFARFAVTRP